MDAKELSKKLKEAYEKMTPEEKEKLKKGSKELQKKLYMGDPNS